MVTYRPMSYYTLFVGSPYGGSAPSHTCTLFVEDAYGDIVRCHIDFLLGVPMGMIYNAMLYKLFLTLFFFLGGGGGGGRVGRPMVT